MILIGENSLQRVVGEFGEHDNTEPAHQSFRNRTIEPKFEKMPVEDKIRCDSRLGGVLNYYYRKAAKNYVFEFPDTTGFFCEKVE
jgi:hypothetical protein